MLKTAIAAENPGEGGVADGHRHRHPGLPRRGQIRKKNRTKPVRMARIRDGPTTAVLGRRLDSNARQVLGEEFLPIPPKVNAEKKTTENRSPSKIFRTVERFFFISPRTFHIFFARGQFVLSARGQFVRASERVYMNIDIE